MIPIPPTASPPPDALESLRTRSFGFVVVHDVKERGHRAQALGRHLTAVFGEPAHTGQGWQAWRVE
jgi:hypothetical protein